ncbi:MAG: hypothetical protein AAFZ05_10755, partial [Pseudomonadota bacterium]
MFVPLHDDNSLKRIPFQYVTVALIAINVAVFVAQTANMVGFNYIRTPSSQFARQLITDGTIGDV